MSDQPRKGKIILAGANPMEFVLSDEVEVCERSPEQRDELRAISETIKAYVKAAEGLLGGKYKHLAALSPAYLSSPGNVLVAVCTNGLVIRYEKKLGERRIAVAVPDCDLAQASLMLSQNLVRVLPDMSAREPNDALGVELKLSVGNPATGATKDIVAVRVWFDVVNTRPTHLSPPPQKPYCLLSVQNQLALELHGETLPVSEGAGSGQPFIARSVFRLMAGWECIEVYPHFDPAQWKPEYAHTWAENDILASALVNQLLESHYRSLDPRAEARKQYAMLLNDFKALLDSYPEREQNLQAFLQANPALLCPAHTRMWPKLPLGARVTDFVFRDATNEYLLVELERSTLQLFRRDGHATSELTRAQGQIVDWKRYLEDNLATVQRELWLTGISTNPQSLIVLGRAHSLDAQKRRKLVAMMNESPKVRILTYDDVYDNAKAIIENLLGPIWDTGGKTQMYFPSRTTP